MRRPYTPSVVAAVLLSALFVALPAGAGSTVVAREAVVTSEQAVGLLPASAPAAGDGDVVSGPDATLARTQAVEQGRPVPPPTVLQVTPAQGTPRDVAVFGVTWQQGSGRSVVVQYRVRHDAAWGPWQGVDVEPTADSAAAGGRAGSEPVIVTGARYVQARVLGPRTDTPVAARLTIVDPGEGPSDAVAGRVAPGSAVAAAGVVAPRVYARTEWGADERIRQGSPSYGVVKAAIVHHTAGTNNYQPDQVPAILRGIYAFHVKSRGWSDIGYNALVDKWGRVWEGRAGGLDRAVVGAHTLGYNSWTTGISVMGDYSATSAPAAAVAAVSRVIGWKARVHGFSSTGRAVLGSKNLPTVLGHRDANATTCPGAKLYAALPSIRTQAAASSVTSPAAPKPAAPRPVSRPIPLPRDFDGAGVSAFLARNSAGRLFSYRAGAAGTVSAGRYVGHGWAGVDTIALGDWDGDRDIDMLARVRGTGQLRLYASNGRGALVSARTIGSGWASRRSVMSPGDVTGDGRPDLLSITSTGRLILNAGAAGTLRGSVEVGRGWSGMRQLIGVGDWTRDGKPDVLAVSTSGQARIYPGTGGGRWGRPTLLGAGWGRFVSLVGVINGPGRSALLGMDGSGRTFWGSAASRSVSWRQLPTSFRSMAVYGG